MIQTCQCVPLTEDEDGLLQVRLGDTAPLTEHFVTCYVWQQASFIVGCYHRRTAQLGIPANEF